MEKLYQYLPEELVTFILVTVFSLLIGLSLRRISLKREGETTLFGTDRTFTFIGILGYLLYILDPVDYRLFMGGGAVLGVLLALNYYVKQAPVPRVRGYHHCHCAHHVLHCAYCRHAALLVLCNGDCDRVALYGVETYIHRIGAADEER